MNVRMFGDGSCRMTHENERLVADSCDESVEGSIGLSGEVESLDHGQEELELCLGYVKIQNKFVSRDR